MIHKPVAMATASTLLKFSTLPAFLVIASVSHISLPTASTLQVLNTSSISCQLLFLTSPYLQRQHFSSSQHFSILPAFLVITSAISHISLPQILQQSLSLPCWGQHLQYFISFLPIIPKSTSGTSTSNTSNLIFNTWAPRWKMGCKKRYLFYYLLLLWFGLSQLKSPSSASLGSEWFP